jgi:hypothetical protein
MGTERYISSLLALETNLVAFTAPAARALPPPPPPAPPPFVTVCVGLGKSRKGGANDFLPVSVPIPDPRSGIFPVPFVTGKGVPTDELTCAVARCVFFLNYFWYVGRELLLTSWRALRIHTHTHTHKKKHTRTHTLSLSLTHTHESFLVVFGNAHRSFSSREKNKKIMCMQLGEGRST